MRHAVPPVLRTAFCVVLVSVLGNVAVIAPAKAQRAFQGASQGEGASPGASKATLEADYTITAASVPVGKAAWTTSITGDRYVSRAVGRAGTAITFFFSGQASVETQGVLRKGMLQPEAFAAKVAGDDDKADIKMSLTDGTVSALSVTPPDTLDHVPVTADQLHGVVDPLSALLIGSAGAGPLGARESCQRTLPIFDGRRRYDLGLSYKRLDRVETAIGYRGSVVVCAVTLRAISGQRRGSPLVTYATDGREIELWLAPLGATRMRAPVRFSIASLLGNLVIAADRFAFHTPTAAQ